MSAQGEIAVDAGSGLNASAPRSRERPDQLRFKTYIVFQRSFKRDPHRPNVRVVAVRLTQAEAQQIVDDTPGTWWERHYASKNKR